VPSACLIGGNGQIGRAVGAALVSDGWEVVAVSRSGCLTQHLTSLGVRPAQADRSDDAQLRAALGDGADVAVDLIAYTRADAEQLLRFRNAIGSAIVISSASVYVDDAGRSLDEATDASSFPRFPVPIPETQATVAPGGETYSTRKVEVEQTLLDSPLPTTVIRPCAIHGPGSSAPRELFFVKRIVDGRRAAVLVSNGTSRFHTTSAGNLAELIRLAARKPNQTVLNCGDPAPPTTSEIGAAVAAALNAQLSLVLIPESGFERPDLSNPWAVTEPVVVDMSASNRDLGYRAISTYADAVGSTCTWIVDELSRRDWSGTYLQEYFNYGAEDTRLLRSESDTRSA
jgi:nucleoside-diphosphate-sugar epimerase